MKVVSLAFMVACAAPAPVVPVTAAEITPAAASAEGPAPYAIPSPAPRGEVRVVTYGVVEIRSTTGSEHVRALHARMSMRNDDTRLWRVDARDQRLALGGHGRSIPAFGATTAGTLPVLAIAPGVSVSVDLFYPLPADLQDTTAVPTFAAITWINVGDEVAVRRTPFERVESGPEPWGPPYWFDVLQSDFGFLGADAVPNALVRWPVVIRIVR